MYINHAEQRTYDSNFEFAYKLRRLAMDVEGRIFSTLTKQNAERCYNTSYHFDDSVAIGALISIKHADSGRVEQIGWLSDIYTTGLFGQQQLKPGLDLEHQQGTLLIQENCVKRLDKHEMSDEADEMTHSCESIRRITSRIIMDIAHPSDANELRRIADEIDDAPPKTTSLVESRPPSSANNIEPESPTPEVGKTDSPKQQFMGMSVEEANRRAMEIFKEHGPKTSTELAKEIPCSRTTVEKTKFWKLYQNRKKIAREQKGINPKAINLGPELLAELTSSGRTGRSVSQSHGSQGSEVFTEACEKEEKLKRLSSRLMV